ncbi:MAG: hypothetical protein WCO00_13680 [Rhodospirillaceae bacterium]
MARIPKPREMIVKLFTRFSGNTVTDSGIAIKEEEITQCNIKIMKTVPVHRASEIQHAADDYLEHNKRKFPGIALGDWTMLPNVSEIATPIYMMFITDKSCGAVVYIGKAESKTNRFTDGHIAALKLLHPKYQRFHKFISFAVVLISTTKCSNVPVELVFPSSLRSEIISYIEHSMVWKFQPCLNTNLKKGAPPGITIETNFWGAHDDYIKVSDIRIRAKGQPIIKGRLCVSMA